MPPPTSAWKETANLISSRLTALNIDDLDAPAQRQVSLIKHLSVDMRLDLRDYELADSQAEQLKLTRTAIKRLERLRQSVLTASEHNIFGTVDVAQISASIDQIIDNIK
jgi:hypothetical protein